MKIIKVGGESKTKLKLKVQNQISENANETIHNIERLVNRILDFLLLHIVGIL